MAISNIIAGSNIFMSRTDDPLKDPEFAAQIEDYQYLTYISPPNHMVLRVARLTDKQRAILSIETRCIYARKDPCWGYVDEKQRVVCKCINADCPKIYDCNPGFTSEEATYWKNAEKEIADYGNPEKLSRYYFVDLISDEEMANYDSNPRNEGFEYTVPPNPVLDDNRNNINPEPQSKIDPITGRKMIVIGREWRIVDNASYEASKLVPIWGYADEIEEQEPVSFVRKKAEKINKLPISESVHRDEDTISGDVEEYKHQAISHITKEIKLTEIDDSKLRGHGIVVLLDNPAELAFVSATFLTVGIDHGILSDSDIRLGLMNDFTQLSDYKQVFISNTVLENKDEDIHVNVWKTLATTESLVRLDINDREWFHYLYNTYSRWTCRGVYGVTHICITEDDIDELEDLADGVYEISLVNEDDSYIIEKMNGDSIGEMGDDFSLLIKSLIEDDEISGYPAVITGISIKVISDQIEILGMGHLKFTEY